MIGLILKDFLNLKRHSKIYFILVIFYFILGITNKDFSMFGSMIAMMAVILPVTSMAYDEKNNWDRYALTMPVSRRDLVLSRYILSFIFLVLAFIISMLLNLIFGSSSFIESVLINSGILLFGIIIMSAIFPVLFKYGVEKGRLFMMIILFAPTAVIMLLSRLGFTLPDKEAAKVLLYFLPVIAVAASAVSVLISVSIYRKKEF